MNARDKLDYIENVIDYEKSRGNDNRVQELKEDFKIVLEAVNLKYRNEKELGAMRQNTRVL